MNRALCISALGGLIALSSCGPLRRLGSRRAAMADTAALVMTPAPDSGFVRADSPQWLGPFMDSVSLAQKPQIPELADDSGMAMQWWQIPLSYSSFSGKAKAHFESPEENWDFTLNVRIESGKKIWMSVVGSAMGISMEAFRAVLTPDSMIAVNRIDKEVIRGPFSDIAGLFPVEGDFYSLEAILVGAKVPSVPELQPVPTDSGAATMNIAGQLGATQQVITFRLADSVMIHQSLMQSGTRTELSYDNYTPSGGRRFAQTLGLVFERASGQQKLDLNYTSFSFDEPVDMSIPIPERYKQR
jgi:hypothetical protein